MFSIEWDEIKFRILSRFLKRYPFLRALSISTINMEKYVETHQLLKNIESEPLDVVLIKAYQEIFKVIGMKVDIIDFLDQGLEEIREIESLSFEPVITFNLNKGLELSTNFNDLYKIERNKLIGYIEKLHMLIPSEKTQEIDLLFGDKSFLKEKLTMLRRNREAVDSVQQLIGKIESKAMMEKKSDEMKDYYTQIIKEEVKIYIEHYDNKKC